MSEQKTIKLTELLPKWREVHRVTEEAIAEVDEAADPFWKDAAEDCLEGVCVRLEYYTADDVWEALDEAGIEWPREPSALGPVMRRAAKNGWAESANRTRESNRPKAHRKPQRVWRSLLYRG